MRYHWYITYIDKHLICGHVSVFAEDIFMALTMARDVIRSTTLNYHELAIITVDRMD